MSGHGVGWAGVPAGISHLVVLWHDLKKSWLGRLVGRMKGLDYAVAG